MRALTAAVVLGVLAACSAGESGTSTGTTVAQVDPAATSTTTELSLRQWLAGGQVRLSELTDAAENLRNLSPGGNNQAILGRLADSADAAALTFRRLPRPSTGQAESEHLTGAIEALSAVARAAAPCASECREAYASVVAAQETVTEALRRVLALGQPSGG